MTSVNYSIHHFFKTANLELLLTKALEVSYVWNNNKDIIAWELTKQKQNKKAKLKAKIKIFLCEGHAITINSYLHMPQGM